MRIVHLSTSDGNGGAARAAHRVHSGLTRLGHESSMLVLKKTTTDPAVISFKPYADLVHRARRRFRRNAIMRDSARYAATRPAGYEIFSDDRTEHGADVARQIPPCDAITLHWIAGLVDYEQLLPALPSNVPLVWRMADMGVITGGCHYDAGCGKFVAQCGACPQLGSSDPQDLSHAIWRRKSGAISRVRSRLHVVGTSQWIAAETRRSSLFAGVPVTVIPNALDTDDFTPRDKGFCRAFWQLPQDARIVLFLADSLENRRKGFRELLESLRGMSGTENLLLLSVGGLKSTIDLPFPHVNLGRISHDRLLSLAYNAADVFVIPSLQESFGQTVIESMACGTPVIGFASGGIPDMVRPGCTGWLAPTGDTTALRDAIRAALAASPEARSRMSVQCRRVALEEYSLDVQAQSYLKLYEPLVASAAGRAA